MGPRAPECLYPTPDSVLAWPYSVAAALYRYQKPMLHLRPAEQKLLSAALAGKTDSELSAELELSIEAVKKRWLSIFDRVDELKPQILNHGGPESDGRGPQKRHRVVAYIRKHKLRRAGILHPQNGTIRIVWVRNERLVETIHVQIHGL